MRRVFFLAAILSVALTAAAGWLLAPGWTDVGDGGIFARSSAGGQRVEVTRRIPVVVTTAAARDVPIYLTGLGRIQASSTVTIRSRVDGHLESVNFREGSDVTAGAVLARIDPRPFAASVQQMAANLKREEARLVSAKADLSRLMQLGVRDFASRQSIDNQQSLVSQAEAAIDGAKAQLAHAQTQLDYTTIRSPITGRAGLRMVDPGNVVRAMDPTGLVVVTQLQPIALMFTLPEEHVGAVYQNHSEARPLPVSALSRDGQTELAPGALATIDNVIDEKTGTFKLKAMFANERRALWPGQFVNARLTLTVRRGAVVVPARVVQRGPSGPFAFVVGADDRVEMRALKVAQTHDGLALIDEGLAPGERVVLDGQFQLEPGSAIVATDVDGRPAAATALPGTDPRPTP